MTQPAPTQFRSPLAWSIAGYGAFFLDGVVGFVTSVLAVRTLSVTEFGAYKLAAAIIMVGSYATSCGLDNMLQRFSAEMIACRRYGALRRLLAWVKLVRAVALVVFCGIVLVAQKPISEFFSFPPILTDLLALVCGILCVQSANGIYGLSFFPARGAYLETSLLRVARSLTRLAGYIIAWLGMMGLMGFLWALFLSPALVLVYVIIRNNQWLRAHPAAVTGSAEIRLDNYPQRIFRYSLVSYLAINVNVFRDLAADSFAIAHYLGPEQVAMYGLAAGLILFAEQLNPANLLRGFLTPLLTARHAVTGSQEGLLRAFLFLNKAVMVLHWPLVTLLLVLGEPIIRLVYSPAYVSAYHALAVLCTFAYVMGLTFPFVPLIAVLEKNILLLLSGLTSIYNLVMVIVLVPKWGIQGAAFATGTASVLQLALYWFAFRCVFGIRISFPFAVVLRTALNLAVPIGIVLFAKDHVTSVMQLLLLITACGLCYCVAVFFNHGLDADELRLFDGLRRRVRS